MAGGPKIPYNVVAPTGMRAAVETCKLSDAGVSF